MFPLGNKKLYGQPRPDYNEHARLLRKFLGKSMSIARFPISATRRRCGLNSQIWSSLAL